MKKYFFLIVTIIGCKGQTLNRDQNFANRISALLNGARVTVKNGFALSTEEGNFRKYQIEIDNLNIDSNKKESDILFASSMPALVFLNEYEKPNEFKYVNVSVSVEKSSKVNASYLLNDLQLVEKALPTFQGFLYGIKEINGDSINTHIDTGLINRGSVSQLLSALKTAAKRMGHPSDAFFQGFSIENYRGKKIVVYVSYLTCPLGEYKVEIGIDPARMKVVYYNL
jgi:hypothetical protein